jgi:hypothetical protein
VILLLEVELFDQIGSLSTVEASDNIQGFVFESKCGMEVSASVQICDLVPGISAYIVHLAFVHTFWWQA